MMQFDRATLDKNRTPASPAKERTIRIGIGEEKGS